MKKVQVRFNKKVAAMVTQAAMMIVLGLLEAGCDRHQPANAYPSREKASLSNAAQADPAVELSENQLNAIKIEPAGTYLFAVEKGAVGTIDFDNRVYFNKNLSVQVFPPYEGTIVKIQVELDDEVREGQPLYTIDSPELAQAEAKLIGAATTSAQAGQERAKEAGAQRAYDAAREAVRAFGKSDAEIDQVIASRNANSELVVRTAISGRITSVNATPGLSVHPGKAPAPVAVANVSTKWMLANIIESDSPHYRVGQPARVRVMAYPGRVFDAKVSRIYPAVDPNTHRVTIRYEIADPRNELRTGMLTEFATQVQKPVESIAIPVNGVVRESDGTMTAWVTSDRRRFVQKTVKTGVEKDGRVQILDGLRRGDLVVSDGAVFLNNMLQGGLAPD